MNTHINIRYLQFMGSLCVAAFCKHFSISHRSISDFLTHQIELLRCPDLATWNTNGKNLPITGMGDPIPEPVLAGIPSDLRADFARLVDSSAEIGVVNLFGAISDQPFRFLRKCSEILSKHNVPSPIGNIEEKIVPWVSPLNNESFDETIAEHAVLLDGYFQSGGGKS